MAEARVAVAPNAWQAWGERLRTWRIPQGLSAAELRNFWRRRLFAVLAGAIAIAAVASVSWWYVVSLGSVSTDDA